jgi:hypothetical protein
MFLPDREQNHCKKAGSALDQTGQTALKTNILTSSYQDGGCSSSGADAVCFYICGKEISGIF